MVKCIVIVFAMEAEAAPCIKSLGLTQDEPRVIPGPAPCVSYSGTYEGVEVHLVWNGRDAEHGVDLVGTVPAALSTYVALQAWPHADVVISAGTAGGFKAKGAAIGDIFGAAIGDVFVSSGKMHHDRRIPLPGFDKFGIGYVATLPTPNMQRELALKTGVVTSGDSLDYTPQCMEVMTKHGAAVKEMEAASIAWAANLFSKPLLCIKAITDIVDGDKATAEEFLENLTAAAAALQGMVPRVVKFLAGRPLDQL